MVVFELCVAQNPQAIWGGSAEFVGLYVGDRSLYHVHDFVFLLAQGIDGHQQFLWFVDILGADFWLVQRGGPLDFTVESVAVVCVVAAVFLGGVDAYQQYFHDCRANGHQRIGNQNAANHARTTAIAATAK